MYAEAFLPSQFHFLWGSKRQDGCLRLEEPQGQGPFPTIFSGVSLFPAIPLIQGPSAICPFSPHLPPPLSQGSCHLTLSLPQAPLSHSVSRGMSPTFPLPHLPKSKLPPLLLRGPLSTVHDPCSSAPLGPSPIMASTHNKYWWAME